MLLKGLSGTSFKRLSVMETTRRPSDWPAKRLTQIARRCATSTLHPHSLFSHLSITYPPQLYTRTTPPYPYLLVLYISFSTTFPPLSSFVFLSLDFLSLSIYATQKNQWNVWPWPRSVSVFLLPWCYCSIHSSLSGRGGAATNTPRAPAPAKTPRKSRKVVKR